MLITLPRLALVGFNIAQPFLVQTTLLFVQGGAAEPAYYGYGLIGAYLLVYLGIAVSCPSQARPYSLLSDQAPRFQLCYIIRRHTVS